LARGVTRCDRVIKFAGGYHGHADAFLANAGSGLATLGIASSPGVPSGVVADTIVCEYNDVDGVASAVERFGEGLAAIFVEPVAGNMGCVPPAPGFLETLRLLCDASGAPAVFDELEQRAARLADGLAPFGRVQRVGAMLTLFVGRDEPVERFSELDTDGYAELFRGLLERGVYFAPSQYECLFPSLAHT